jgi:hypothetical protein
MDLVHITDLKFWFIVIIQLIGFTFVCLKLYAKSYSSEKGKNLATKEDVGEITQIVESIKTTLALKTEELKSDLSYKNEHLIHLRAAERAAIINYYKATWVLVLNFTKPGLLVKYEIDNFKDKDDEVSDLELRRYISEAESILNKIKEELSNLRYLQDISKSELMFFCDDPALNLIIDELNFSLSGFEKILIGSINSLLQVFKEVTIKINTGELPKGIIIEAKRKRSEILTKFDDVKPSSLSNIRILDEELKKTLHHRLKNL